MNHGILGLDWSGWYWLVCSCINPFTLLRGLLTFYVMFRCGWVIPEWNDLEVYSSTEWPPLDFDTFSSGACDCFKKAAFVYHWALGILGMHCASMNYQSSFFLLGKNIPFQTLIFHGQSNFVNGEFASHLLFSLRWHRVHGNHNSDRPRSAQLVCLMRLKLDTSYGIWPETKSFRFFSESIANNLVRLFRSSELANEWNGMYACIDRIKRTDPCDRWWICYTRYSYRGSGCNAPKGSDCKFPMDSVVHFCYQVPIWSVILISHMVPD